MYLKTIEGYYVNTDHISSMLPNGKSWVVITSADERYSIMANEAEKIVGIHKEKAEVKTNGNKDTKKRSTSKKKV